ncbi:MAG TPA: PQQ-binding-like beta-propeller repeat protein [Solirubrobacteraceae bacterium]
MPLTRSVRGHTRRLGFRATAAVIGLLLPLALAPGAMAARAGCSARPSGSGEWPVYGHDLANSRNQRQERKIGPRNVSGLSTAWVFSSADHGDQSAFNTTPVASGGCVFIGSAAGYLYAINASNGRLVWKQRPAVTSPGFGGTIVSAAAVHGRDVIWLVNQANRPYAIALDRSTGAVRWQSAPLISKSGYYTNASPTVARGMVVAGYSDPEGNDVGSGGFALINARTGATIKVIPVVSRRDQARGYAGGGLWDTPAFDPSTGYLYYGTGNPDSKTKQDPNTDAIVKVDLNRHLPGSSGSNPRFGQIVARYPGNIDQYTNALHVVAQTPACTASDSSGAPWPLDDPVCGQLDLDFGASPNLFRDASGTELVGELQKAGVYHVANARTMAPVWHRVVGAPCAACNAGSSAFDGRAIDVVGTPGSTLFALGDGTGAMNWSDPLGDGLHYQSTSAANGVVYAVDNDGFLDAFDAATGQPLLKRQLSADTGAPTGGGLTSNGVSIAEGEILVAGSSASGDANATAGSSPGAGPDGAYVVAYR